VFLFLQKIQIDLFTEMKISRGFTGVLKVLVGVILLYIIIRQIDLHDLLQKFRVGNLNYLIPAIIILSVSQVLIQSFRFHYIVGNLKLRYSFSLDIYLIGLFFNNLLPTAVGGDIVRTHLLKKKSGITYSESVTYVALHRFSGLLSLFLLFGLFILIDFQNLLNILKGLAIEVSSQSVLIVLIILAVLFGVGLYFKTRVLSFLRIGIKTMKQYTPFEIFVIFILALLFHGTTMVGMYLLVLFFNENIDFQYLIIIQTFSALAALLPVSIGALGVLEGTIAGLFVFFGLTRLSATGIALIYRVILIVFSIVGLLVMFLKGSQYNTDGLFSLKEDN